MKFEQNVLRIIYGRKTQLKIRCWIKIEKITLNLYKIITQIKIINLHQFYKEINYLNKNYL